MFSSRRRTAGKLTESSAVAAPTAKQQPEEEEIASGGTMLMRKYGSDTVVLASKNTALSNLSRISADAAASHYDNNIGRVAAPLRAAATLHAATLLTSTILPERDSHNDSASHNPLLVTLSEAGDVGLAPEGSTPFTMIPATSTTQIELLSSRNASDGIKKQQPSWLDATMGTIDEKFIFGFFRHAR